MSTGSRMTIRPGQVWQDTYEPARVVAVAEGYAMMRRHGSNPFLIPIGALKAGAHGWQQLDEHEAKAYFDKFGTTAGAPR